MQRRPVQTNNVALVGQVQQQIQVLAAEQRSVQEQIAPARCPARAPRCATSARLQAPDEQGLARLESQWQQAREDATVADARLHTLQDALPALEQARRDHQQSVNTEASRQAALSARMEALKALQEKVKTDGKLQPWLQKHGLESLAGLWTRIHVQQGWENALEAALRERMGALEVSRLDMVRAFAKEPPPAKLVFFSLPQAAVPAPAGALPLLADLLQLNDAGLAALLRGWLQGCFTAPDLEQALAARASLQSGEVIYVQDGHAVSAHSVALYAPDSEQAGMLARAQEIENLEKQLRAQTLICEQARHDLARAESALGEASQHLVQLRRDAAALQSQAHALQVETLRVRQQAEQARARGSQLAAELAETDALLEELQERRVTAEARFEELDMQLADAQERQAQVDDRVILAERALAESREQQRTVERQAQEAEFALRSLRSRQAELERAITTATQQAASIEQEQASATQELTRLSDAAAQAGLHNALALKLEREQQLGATRSEYDDLTAKLRASDERRLTVERALDPLRQKITDLQLKEQAARLGSEQYQQLLDDAHAEIDVVRQSIENGKVRLDRGTAVRHRSPECRDRGAGCRQPGRAGRAGRSA